MSNGLDRAAISALDSPRFTRVPGWCQKFVRQVIQSVHSGRFDAFHEPTAHESMLAWKNTPYAVPVANGSVPGDILYYREKLFRKHGHVAIRIAGNQVAENSTAHLSIKRGGKGVRALSRLGTPDLIVRLPASRSK
jgi:hypothetical protein